MIDIALPSLGPDMESGTLLEWRIAPGQKISKGTIIAVVDTEKAAIDVESWHEGVVAELIAQPGQVLAVGTVIARLAAPASTTIATTPAAPIPAAPKAAAPSPAAPSPIRASPAARARAQAMGIDLAQWQTTDNNDGQVAIALDLRQPAHDLEAIHPGQAQVTDQ